MKSKLEIIIREFNESCPEGHLPKMPNVDVFKFGEMKERIMEQLESYTGTPFTIQRLCELLVQPKRHYKRTDKFMRGLEKIMLVVSTIDPNPNLQDEASKQESSECNSFESPSKRIRLASGDDEPGPCDSADEASIAGVSMEIVAGPSSKDDNNVVMENGVNGDHHAAAARVDDGGEENMDIDTECTSSQARLSVTEPAPDDSAETGVESSAAAEAVNNTSDEVHDTMETVARDNQPETGVESSSSAAEVVTGGQPTMSDDGVTTSAVASDRPDLTMEDSHEDTNSEAEPAEAEHDNLEVGEAAPNEVGVESDQSDQVVAR